MSHSTLAWIGFAVITFLIVLTADRRYKSIFLKKPEHEVPRAKATWDTMFVAVCLIIILPALELPSVMAHNSTNFHLGVIILLFYEINFRIRLMTASSNSTSKVN